MGKMGVFDLQTVETTATKETLAGPGGLLSNCQTSKAIFGEGHPKGCTPVPENLVGVFRACDGRGDTLGKIDDENLDNYEKTESFCESRFVTFEPRTGGSYVRVRRFRSIGVLWMRGKIPYKMTMWFIWLTMRSILHILQYIPDFEKNPSLFLSNK
jgi:hypothetical protein